MARKTVATKSNKATQSPLALCTALYARVSTANQVDGYSLDAQQAKLQAFCFAQGWDVCPDHIYIDAGESGKSTDRPAFNAMMAAAHEGKIARIVSIKLDRVARNAKAFLDLVDELQAIGVDLVLMAENFDAGTPNGKFVLNMFAAMAELERSTIRDRVMTGRKQKARSGGFCGGNVPLGYTYDNGKFTPNADSKTVQAIFAMFNTGDSLTAIASHLDAQNAPTSKGGKWAIRQVRYILSNGAYAGLSQWDGVETTNGEYPAIITLETYEMAQSRLATLKRGNPNFV